MVLSFRKLYSNICKRRVTEKCNLGEKNEFYDLLPELKRINAYPLLLLCVCWGFPGGSGGKESACNSRGVDSIPGSCRSPEEGNGSTFQYSYLESSWTDEPGRLQSIGLQRVGRD